MKRSDVWEIISLIMIFIGIPFITVIITQNFPENVGILFCISVEINFFVFCVHLERQKQKKDEEEKNKRFLNF